MPKFCGQCGAQLSDEATFCTNCGAAMGAQQTPQQAAQPVTNTAAQGVNPYAQPDFSQQNAAASAQPDYSNGMNNIQYGYGSAAGKPKISKQALMVLGGVVVLVIILIVVLCTAFGSSYKTPIENMIKVMEDGDGDAMRNMLAKSQIDAMENVYSLFDEDGMDKYFDDAAESVHDGLVDQYGDNFKISYEIIDKEELDSDELSDIEDSYSYLSDSKVTAGYKLEVKMTIKGDEEKTDKDEITVVKVDGDWVTTDASMM